MKNKIARYTTIGAFHKCNFYDKFGNLLESMSVCDSIEKRKILNVPNILVHDCFTTEEYMNKYFKQVDIFIKTGVKNRLLN